MASDKVLVAYATKSGVTEDNAKIIANVLKEDGFLVDVVDLRKSNPGYMANYGFVVLGSGVRIGKIYDEFYKFLDKNNFNGKKVALFFSSGEAGNQKGISGFTEKYIKPVLAKYPKIDIVDAEGFGGMMKILFKTVIDNRDPKKVEAWAKELSKKFKS
ncbi:MAG: flavodoxin family protein [Candidatus Aenigmatarchaeota archaeon]